MKNILILLLVPVLIAASPPAVLEGDTQTFLSPVKVVGEIYQWMDHILSTVPKTTTEAITLYVETTGNDNNDCLSVGAACLTIQEAVNRIPKNVRHNVQITVGSGTFAGFIVDEFNVGPFPTTMIVEGTQAEPTLVSGGKTNATADGAGGSTSTLSDADGGWNVDELKGMSVQIGTVRRIVRSNTGTLISFAAPFSSTCNGKAYQVLENKTVVTTIASSVITSAIHIYGCHSENAGFIISKFKVTPANAAHYGVFGFGNDGITVREVLSTGAAASGIHLQQNPGMLVAWNVTATGARYGINIIDAPTIGQLRLFAYSNTSSGVTLQNAYGIGAYTIQLTADSNSAGGVFVLNNSGFTHSTSGFFNLVWASNNTGPGFVVGGGEIGAVGASITGSGNTTFGARVERFGRLVINGLPTITGTSGDFTMDITGTVVGTWATDLGAAGDSVNNVSDGSWIIRR